MALDKAGYKSTVKAGILAGYPGTPTAAQVAAADSLAGILADAADTLIKSGTWTVAAGIPVSTTGTAVAQTGATTATGSAAVS